MARQTKWLEVIAAVSFNEEDVSSPLIAEIKVLWRAMNLCLEIGLNNVIFKGVAKKVVDGVINPEKNWSIHGQLIKDIKWPRRRRRDWSIIWLEEIWLHIF